MGMGIQFLEITTDICRISDSTPTCMAIESVYSAERD
jgi:hypothetical protein